MTTTPKKAPAKKAPAKKAPAKKAAAKKAAAPKPAPDVEPTEADEEANRVKAEADDVRAAAEAVQVQPPPQPDPADLVSVDEVPNPSNDDTVSLNEALETTAAANLARAHAQVDDSSFVVPTESGRTPVAVEVPVPEYEVGEYVMAGAYSVSNANGTYFLDDAGYVESFEAAE